MWFAVFSGAGDEWEVNEGLKREGFETLFPHVVEIDRSKFVKVAFFPRYFFVSSDADDLFKLITLLRERLSGCLVSSGVSKRPLVVDDELINLIREACDTFEGEIFLAEPTSGPHNRFKRGDTIRFGDTGGALQGLLAAVECVRGRKLGVKLKTPILGQDRLEVSSDDVELYS